MKKFYAALVYTISGAILIAGSIIAIAINQSSELAYYIMLAGVIICGIAGYIIYNEIKKPQ